MEKCPYNQSSCVLECTRTDVNACGFKCFLGLIKDAQSRFTAPKDSEMIRDLKARYSQAVDKNPKSGGRGPATDKAFEEWVKHWAGQGGEKGKVDFTFGPFNVDLAIPSRKEPIRAILEMKVAPSLQDALAVKGLLDFSKGERKVGYVMLRWGSHGDEVRRILNKLKQDSAGRFNYFVISDGWKDTIEELRIFLR